MEERDLEQLARALGRERASELHPERVAEGVVRRLRSEPAGLFGDGLVWWRSPLLLRLAAAVVLLAAGAWLFFGVSSGDGRERVVAPVPQLYELSEEQLVEVLDSLAVEGPIFEQVVVLSDLTEGELRELLRIMEG
jgi:hypothetical protein